MKKLIIALFLLLTNVPIFAQVAMGQWRTHLSYSSTSMVENTSNKVYGVSNGALFSVSKDNNEIETYSKVNGLNDKNVSLIRYSETAGNLIIFYSDGNIDILSDVGTITNIPDIKNKTLSVDKKTVSVMFTDDGYAFLSSEIGIVKMNLSKKEISDTYIIGDKSSYLSVLSTAILGDSIYALTQQGVYVALKSDPLLVDYNNWHFRDNLPMSDVNNKQLISFAGKLILLKSSGQIYYSIDAQNWNILNDSYTYSGLRVCGNSLVLSSSSFVVKYNTLLEQENITSLNTQDAVYDEANNTYWLAAANNGLQEIQKGVVAQSLKPDGPALNTTFALKYQDGRLFANTGKPRAFDASSTDVLGALMILYDNTWHNYDESIMQSLTGYALRSLCYTAIDPNDVNHFFLSSLRHGLYEFKNNTFYKLYNASNSILEVADILKSNSCCANGDDYVTIDAPVVDKNNIVWVTNELVTSTIKVMDNGTWYSLNYAPISGVSFLDKMIVSENNYKWLNIPRSSGGVFVINDNGYPTSVSQQKYKLFNSAIDQDGNTISLVECRCVAEDANNDIWVGTDDGIVLFQNISNVFNSGYAVYRPKIARNDGTNYADYLLDGNAVMAIAVDGANRKWVSVKNAGVYLLSSDGLTTIHHFTEDNSPLLSNEISSIAVNGETGEVFFATDNGLISYMSDATDAKPNFNHINVYPNPVRPCFSGTITIMGLMDDSSVKITDIYGNLVCQMKSNGGTATWNGCDNAGKLVKAGTYIIMGAVDENGTIKAGMGKVLILR